METHLRFEPDDGDRGSPAAARLVPVHVVFNQDTLSYGDFRALSSVTYRVVSPEGAGPWRRVPYVQRVDRDFSVGSLFRRERARLSADPGPGVPAFYGDERERCNFGLVFTALVRVREGAWWHDLLRIRLLVRDEEVVEIDCTLARLLWEGFRFFERVRRNRPAAVGGRPGGRGGGAAIAAEAEAEAGRDEEELPEDVAAQCGLDFFELDDRRRMSEDMERRLARFAKKRVSAVDFGPLEPPSKVRGREIVNPRGEFFSDGEAVEVPPPVRSRTDRWFGSDNAVCVSRVQGVLGPRSFLVVWYSESAGADVEGESDGLDDGPAVVLCFQHVRRWDLTLTRVYNAAAAGLGEAVRRGGALAQRFRVDLCSDLRGRDLAELLGLSRDVWLVNATGDGCIIKALSHDLRPRRRDYERSDGLLGWADVIRYSSGKVDGGLAVRLVPAGPSGLWRSVYDDGEPTGWETDPRACVLYALIDGTLVWALPGGFSAVFALAVDHADAQVIREKFEEC
ncbi:pR93 [rat cytomegalovirus strain Maastricht]|uniref:PR93 n=1 Tax=Rat cytomegalovirus (strain Maastricht) TaxID=79700 RepID=Q9DWA9_RCMVM|nr:pR93 [rat cytomegalovirus strain Maastricht]AAF99181.1 pR93 [rat cytomegalovirus strain Maastricht]WEG72014.1 DNA packaging tegument protein UL17 [Murid betaherpesvirus 2]